MNYHTYERCHEPWKIIQNAEHGEIPHKKWQQIAHTFTSFGRRIVAFLLLSSCFFLLRFWMHLSWICDRKTQPIIMFVVRTTTTAPYTISFFTYASMQLHTLDSRYRDSRAFARVWMHLMRMTLCEALTHRVCGREVDASAFGNKRKCSNRGGCAWNASDLLNRSDSRIQTENSTWRCRCIQFPFRCVDRLRSIALMPKKEDGFLCTIWNAGKLHASLVCVFCCNGFTINYILLICSNCNLKSPIRPNFACSLKPIDFIFVFFIRSDCNRVVIRMKFRGLHTTRKKWNARKACFGRQDVLIHTNEIRNGF